MTRNQWIVLCFFGQREYFSVELNCNESNFDIGCNKYGFKYLQNVCFCRDKLWMIGSDCFWIEMSRNQAVIYRSLFKCETDDN